MDLLDRHLAPNWLDHKDDPPSGIRCSRSSRGPLAGPPRAQGHPHDFIREDARHRFAGQHKEAAQVVGAGTLLDPKALTIGFARPVRDLQAGQPDLPRSGAAAAAAHQPLASGADRVRGQSPPGDDPGKEVLQSVYQFTRDPAFEAGWRSSRTTTCTWPICWCTGADLWLNLPRPPLEASGTTDERALNGVPQLGRVDGCGRRGTTA